MKKRTGKQICLCATAVLIAFLSAVLLKWDTVFQRGNPIPYLAAAARLSEDNPFEAVKSEEGIYITRRGDNLELFRMIRNTYDVEYIDQLGSGYLFSDGEYNYIVGSEIYWGVFTVWTVSFDEGFPR